MRGPYFLVCRFWRCSIAARSSVCSHMLFLLLLPVFSNVTAQRLKIDSLKNRLPLLDDTARVDCFNALSLLYTYIDADSATVYQQQAFQAATPAGYVRGAIMSMNNKAHIAGMCLHDFPLQEQLSMKTIRDYSNRADKTVMASTYMNLALALFCQSYFDRAADACDSAVQFARQSGNKKQLGEGLAIMGSISFESGNYEKSFEYFNLSLSIFKSIGDAYNTAILLAKLGDFYGLAGDRKAALDLYFQSLKYPKGSSLVWHPLVDLGDTYYSTQRYDSTFYDQDKYMQTIKSLTIRSNYVSFPKIITAEMNMVAKDYDKALPLLLGTLNTSTKSNDQNQLMRSLLDIAKIYTATKNYLRAFFYTKKLLMTAQDRKAKQYLRDGYQLLYTLYDQGHQTDSAYFYYRQYTSMKNIMSLDDFNKKIAIYEAATENEKKQLQISALTNEKLLGQQKLELSEQKLQKESFFRNILIAGVLILVLFGFVLYRNNKLKQKNDLHRHEIVEKELVLQKLESERSSIAMEKRSTELELKALRAQMNPHFIFNCLNSINRFTMNNEPVKAVDYLTKFAKLIRIILQDSGTSFTPLEEELNGLRLYIDLEALRFNTPFSYAIDVGAINTAGVMLPPMLLQPFVENAIWHGLHPKQQDNSKLRISFNLNHELLHCSICDNGVGRSRSSLLEGEHESGKKSLGIKLTQNRLHLYEAALQDDAESGIIFDDLTDEKGNSAGTCVYLRIPVKLIE
jgi:Histidine kinase/Tetratricopeptide repeat